MNDGAPIIQVGFDGFDHDGNDYTLRATRTAIRAGFMTSRDVILKYPNGRTEAGKQVLITPKGLAHLRANMPHAARTGGPIGSA